MLLHKQIITLSQDYPNPLPVDPCYTENMFWKAHNHPGMFLRFLVEESTAHGYFLGQISTEMFTANRIGAMLGMWADDESKGHILDVVNDFEEWCKERRVAKVVLHLSPPSNFDRWERVLKRKGFLPEERLYAKEV